MTLILDSECSCDRDIVTRIYAFLSIPFNITSVIEVKPLDIINYSGPTGAGKSEKTKDNVIAVTGLHLYVVPRILGVQEVTNDLARKRELAGVLMSLNPFFCEQTSGKATDCEEIKQARRKGGSVAKRVIDRIADYNATMHTCFVITYATFLAIDQSIFAGWMLHMDEIPAQAVISGQVYNPVMWRAYESFYALVPIDGSPFSRLIRNEHSTVEYIDILRDDALSQADKNLYARVQTPTPVYIKAKTMSDLGSSRCEWYSAWTLAETSAYKSVEIAASDLTESLMYKAHPLEYIDSPVDAAPSLAEVIIYYYDDGNQRCSAHYFDTPQGKVNLRLIAASLEQSGGVDYYSCNATSVDLLGSYKIGMYVPPMIEGTNSLRDLTSCAYFFSAKAQGYESIYAEVFESATKKSIGLIREGSAIYQFVTRSKMRIRSYSGTILVHLYDRQQAEELQAKLISVGYLNTRIEHHQLDGFVNRPFLKTGPKVEQSTPDERKQRDCDKARARKRAQRSREKMARMVEASCAQLGEHGH